MRSCVSIVQCSLSELDRRGWMNKVTICVLYLCISVGLSVFDLWPLICNLCRHHLHPCITQPTLDERMPCVSWFGSMGVTPTQSRTGYEVQNCVTWRVFLGCCLCMHDVGNAATVMGSMESTISPFDYFPLLGFLLGVHMPTLHSYSYSYLWRYIVTQQLCVCKCVCAECCVCSAYMHTRVYSVYVLNTMVASCREAWQRSSTPLRTAILRLWGWWWMNLTAARIQEETWVAS